MAGASRRFGQRLKYSIETFIGGLTQNLFLIMVRNRVGARPRSTLESIHCLQSHSELTMYVYVGDVSNVLLSEFDGLNKYE